MARYELFTNEPFFAGCSEDVALQVLASAAPLELPMARISDMQAQHLLAKILLKKPKERAPVEAILRHAYLVGGLDTQQVGGSFAMLHESQSAFKTELGKLQKEIFPSDASFAAAGGGGSFGGGGGSSFGAGRAGSSFKKTASFNDKRAKFAGD